MCEPAASAAFCASAVIYNVSSHTIAMSRKLKFSATIYYIYTKNWRLESLITSLNILNKRGTPPPLWRDLHISVLWHFCFMRHRWKHSNKRKKTPGYSSSGKPPLSPQSSHWDWDRFPGQGRRTEEMRRHKRKKNTNSDEMLILSSHMVIVSNLSTRIEM